MNTKTKTIIGWVLSGLLALLFFFSAYTKLFDTSTEAVKNAGALGLTISQMQVIGVIELLAIILFLIPRTGLLGLLLLAAYMGGAIATMLEHQQPVIIPAVVQAIVWIAATLRFPELSQRLLGKPISTLQKSKL